MDQKKLNPQCHVEDIYKEDNIINITNILKKNIKHDMDFDRKASYKSNTSLSKNNLRKELFIISKQHNRSFTFTIFLLTYFIILLINDIFNISEIKEDKDKAGIILLQIIVILCLVLAQHCLNKSKLYYFFYKYTSFSFIILVNSYIHINQYRLNLLKTSNNENNTNDIIGTNETTSSIDSINYTYNLILYNYLFNSSINSCALYFFNLEIDYLYALSFVLVLVNNSLSICLYINSIEGHSNSNIITTELIVILVIIFSLFSFRRSLNEIKQEYENDRINEISNSYYLGLIDQFNNYKASLLSIHYDTNYFSIGNIKDSSTNTNTNKNSYKNNTYAQNTISSCFNILYNITNIISNKLFNNNFSSFIEENNKYYLDTLNKNNNNIKNKFSSFNKNNPSILLVYNNNVTTNNPSEERNKKENNNCSLEKNQYFSEREKLNLTKANNGNQMNNINNIYDANAKLNTNDRKLVDYLNNSIKNNNASLINLLKKFKLYKSQGIETNGNNNSDLYQILEKTIYQFNKRLSSVYSNENNINNNLKDETLENFTIEEISKNNFFYIGDFIYEESINSSNNININNTEIINKHYYSISFRFFHYQNNLLSIDFIFNDNTHKINLELKEREIQMQGKMFSKAAHEFKTPLITITSQLDALNEKILNDEETEEIIEMATSIKHLAHYINYLILDIIQYKNPDTFIKKEDIIKSLCVNIKTDIILFNFLVLNALLNYSTGSKNNIQSKVLFDDQIEQYAVNTNTTKFNQIILNLLSNSVKFTKTGHIMITCYLERNKEAFENEELIIYKQNNLNSINYKEDFEENYIHRVDFDSLMDKNSNNNNNNELKQELAIIKVMDTGKGMNSDYIKALQEGNIICSQTKGNSMGSGLGMGITKQLCNALDFEFSVISEEDRGSIFTIKFLVNKEIMNKSLTNNTNNTNTNNISNINNVSNFSNIERKVTNNLYKKNNLEVAYTNYHYNDCNNKNFKYIDFAIDSIYNSKLNLTVVNRLSDKNLLKQNKYKTQTLNKNNNSQNANTKANINSFLPKLQNNIFNSNQGNNKNNNYNNNYNNFSNNNDNVLKRKRSLFCTNYQSSKNLISAYNQKKVIIDKNCCFKRTRNHTKSLTYNYNNNSTNLLKVSVKKNYHSSIPFNTLSIKENKNDTKSLLNFKTSSLSNISRIRPNTSMISPKIANDNSFFNLLFIKKQAPNYKKKSSKIIINEKLKIKRSMKRFLFSSKKNSFNYENKIINNLSNSSLSNINLIKKNSANSNSIWNKRQNVISSKKINKETDKNNINDLRNNHNKDKDNLFSYSKIISNNNSSKSYSVNNIPNSNLNSKLNSNLNSNADINPNILIVNNVDSNSTVHFNSNIKLINEDTSLNDETKEYIPSNKDLIMNFNAFDYNNISSNEKSNKKDNDNDELDHSWKSSNKDSSNCSENSYNKSKSRKSLMEIIEDEDEREFDINNDNSIAYNKTNNNDVKRITQNLRNIKKRNSLDSNMLIKENNKEIIRENNLENPPTNSNQDMSNKEININKIIDNSNIKIKKVEFTTKPIKKANITIFSSTNNSTFDNLKIKKKSTKQSTTFKAATMKQSQFTFNQNNNITINSNQNSNLNNANPLSIKNQSLLSKQSLKLKEIDKDIILICDDSAIILASLEKMMLSIKEIKEKYLIVKVNDGANIISSVYQDQLSLKIKAVFTDESMEFINGSLAISILTNAEKEKKINGKRIYISITGFSNPDTVKELEAKGFNQVLQKPISKDIIIKCLRDHKLL